MNGSRIRAIAVAGALGTALVVSAASAYVFSGRDRSSSAASVSSGHERASGSSSTTSTTGPTTTTGAPLTTTVENVPAPADTSGSSGSSGSPGGDSGASGGSPAPAPAPAPAPTTAPPPPPPPPPPPSFCTGGPGGLAADIIAAMNGDRGGIGGLCANAQLSGIAQNWANWMAANHSLTHQNLSALIAGTSFSTMGENLLDGPSGMTASQMEAAWMASPGHRANILDGAFKAAGVGIATDSSGLVWVCVDFGG